MMRSAGAAVSKISELTQRQTTQESSAPLKSHPAQFVAQIYHVDITSEYGASFNFKRRIIGTAYLFSIQNPAIAIEVSCRL